MNIALLFVDGSLAPATVAPNAAGPSTREGKEAPALAPEPTAAVAGARHLHQVNALCKCVCLTDLGRVSILKYNGLETISA